MLKLLAVKHYSTFSNHVLLRPPQPSALSTMHSAGVNFARCARAPRAARSRLGPPLLPERSGACLPAPRGVRGAALTNWPAPFPPLGAAAARFGPP